MTLLELDYVHLGLADPNNPVRRIRVIVANRLPALWVDVLAGLVDRHWNDFDQGVIDSLISGWQAARTAAGLVPGIPSWPTWHSPHPRRRIGRPVCGSGPVRSLTSSS